LGQANTILYQLAKVHPSYFHDITAGNNSVPCASGSPNCDSNGFVSGYNASTGYDLATGLGSVDAATIVDNWKSVVLGSTSTTLQINGSTTAYSGVHGASLSFNAGVTGSSGMPTGVVALTDDADMTMGGTALGPQNNGQITMPLADGSVSTTYNGLPGGSYQVTARYGGDTSFAASTSVPISVSISPESSTTTLTVNAYNPATGKTITGSSIPYGFDVFADAAITGAAEGSKSQGVATGTVQFLNGSTALGSGAVSSGNEASWPPLNSTFTALPAGSYTLNAQYSGDASYSPSTGTASFTIAKASTTTTAGFGGTPVEYGNQEQIAADALTNSYGVAPTGTFQFSVDGQPVLAPQPVYESGGYNNANGSNNWAWADSQTTYTFLAVGQHTLSASYSGDGNYGASTSSSVNLSVAPAQTSFTTYGWNVPGGAPTLGQQTTATGTVFGSEHGAEPTGTITFYDNGTAIGGTVTYSGQAANGPVGSSLAGTIPYTFTNAGNHSLTASYSGDTNYLAATSGSDVVTVLGPFSASAGALTVTAPGQSGTTVLTVTPNGAFAGTVTLSCTAPASAAETTCGFGTGASFAPTAQLAVAGATVTTNFQVTTTAQHQVASLSGWRSRGLLLAALLIVVAPRKRYRGLCLVILSAILLLASTSCGSGGSGGNGRGGGTTDQGTLAGTYNFTVTATTGSGVNIYSTSTEVSVTVQ
jgi:hypothetical protein